MNKDLDLARDVAEEDELRVLLHVGDRSLQPTPFPELERRLGRRRRRGAIARAALGTVAVAAALGILFTGAQLFRRPVATQPAATPLSTGTVPAATPGSTATSPSRASVDASAFQGLGHVAFAYLIRSTPPHSWRTARASLHSGSAMPTRRRSGSWPRARSRGSTTLGSSPWPAAAAFSPATRRSRSAT